MRRIIARILDLPIHRIRVVKPRIGGGFGVKQEVLVEDVCALVTMRTGRPARWEYTRAEEFVSARTRHPFRIRVKVGARADGVLHAIEMDATQNTGAYGTHSLTVLSNAGSKTLPLYNKAPHVRFTGRSVYTNLPVGGAYRGYGGTQASFALETALDQMAERLGLDPVELRRRNHIRSGETSPIFAELGRGARGGAHDHQVVRPARVPHRRHGGLRLGPQARPARATPGPSAAGWACRSTCRARASP